MPMEHAVGSIRTRPCPNCYLCGTLGTSLYHGLKDRLFDAPGEWRFKECTNPDCGLIWLDPIPVKEEIGKAYQNYYTHGKVIERHNLIYALYLGIRDGYLQNRYGYTQGVGARWQRHLAWLAALNPFGPDEFEGSAMFLSAQAPGARLLEVGCGDGKLLARMHKMGWEVEGIDFDPLAVEAARSRGISVRLGELAAQNYQSNHFDAIYMGHVIEHVHDPIGLLRECHRVLSPDGILVVVTPNTQSWGHSHFRQDWRGLEPPRHVCLYGVKNLQRVAVAANFNVKSVRTLARGAHYILAMSDALKSGRLSGSKAPAYGKVTLRLKGLLYQMWSRILLLTRPYAGEEILLVAKKPAE